MKLINSINNIAQTYVAAAGTVSTITTAAAMHHITVSWFTCDDVSVKTINGQALNTIKTAVLMMCDESVVMRLFNQVGGAMVIIVL